MTPCNYAGLDGSIRVLDLDAVIDVAKGPSQRKPGWQALIVYDERANLFVELRDSPQDYRGNAEDEAEQVTEQYVCETFKLDPGQLDDLRRMPRSWQLINRAS